MSESGRLTTVIVPRAAAGPAHNEEDAERLIQAVVTYVNDVQQAGVYARHELPAKAMQAYHANYYLAEVSNGGHSQLVHNCGEIWPAVVADALAALDAMGAQAQRRILGEAAAWVGAHPQEAGLQNGFSVRSELLDVLDARFYEAEREMPMTPLAASWIAGWPELRIVADDQYMSAIKQVAALNPQLGPRRIWQSTDALRHQITAPLQISITVACGAVEPEPEAKTEVRAGAYMEIEGRQCLAFGVGTDKGSRLCVADAAGVRLYEFIDPTPKWTPDLQLEDIIAAGPARAGARLSAASADTILQFAAMAQETQAAEALDLILRAARLDPRAMITAWRLLDDGATWIVVSGGRRLVATVSHDGAALVDAGGKPIFSVTKAEIERHAAEAARGLATMLQPSTR